VVAASAREMEDLVAKGRFREDLFYRLNVFHLRVPPLRDRPADLPLLTKHFIRKAAQFHGLPQCEITPKAMQFIRGYPWPGNVRELENAMERAVVLADGRPIEPQDLPEKIRTAVPAALPVEEGDLSVKRNLREIERRLIVQALEKSRGNKSKAAKALDLSFRALLYKIRDYRIDSGGEAVGESKEDDSEERS
jgi:two-component system response regulator AtoC